MPNMAGYARLARSVPAVWLFWSVGGLLLWCPATVAESRDWSNDEVVSKTVAPVLESLSSSAQQAISLHSQVLLRYTRKPNWWAACFIPVGYLPPSFQITVECQIRLSVSSSAASREFLTAVKNRRTVWGQAPNPERPAQDQDYEGMEAEVRKQAARLVTEQVAVWLKHESI